MPGKEAEMATSTTAAWLTTLRGFEEPDLSALEGLEPEDLEALEALTDAGLTAEQIAAMAAENEPSEAEQELAGVREALRKERLQRRQLQKQLKAAGVKPPVKKAAAKQGSTESETDDEELQQAVTKAEKLAGQLATSAVNTAIMQVMNSNDKKVPKFTDIDDVLQLISRGDIDVEQDDDDPSQITVDKDTIKEALKALAKKKPHLLTRDDGEGGKGGGKPDEKPGTGSKFGGGRRGNESSQTQALMDKYPALKR